MRRARSRPRDPAPSRGRLRGVTGSTSATTRRASIRRRRVWKAIAPRGCDASRRSRTSPARSGRPWTPPPRAHGPRDRMFRDPAFYRGSARRSSPSSGPIPSCGSGTPAARPARRYTRWRSSSRRSVSRSRCTDLRDRHERGRAQDGGDGVVPLGSCARTPRTTSRQAGEPPSRSTTSRGTTTRSSRLAAREHRLCAAQSRDR